MSISIGHLHALAHDCKVEQLGKGEIWGAGTWGEEGERGEKGKRGEGEGGGEGKGKKRGGGGSPTSDACQTVQQLKRSLNGPTSAEVSAV